MATHIVTGMKYFGKTTKFHTVQDLQNNYHGSGKYWKRHLDKHGDTVTMQIFYQSNNTEIVSKVAKCYSTFWDIVKSPSYANLIYETGFDGGAVRDGMSNSKEHNVKISSAHYGKKLTAEHKEKLRISHLNPNEEVRSKMSVSQKIRMLDPKQRKIISEALIGHTNNTQEVRDKISLALKGIMQAKLTCPYCGKVGGNAMKRWHFDNCKQKGS